MIMEMNLTGPSKTLGELDGETKVTDKSYYNPPDPVCVVSNNMLLIPNTD